MGILDAIFGTNTAQAQNNANAVLSNGVSSNAQSNASILNNSAGNAAGALQTGANNASSALSSNYGAGADALTGYNGQAQGILSNGINNAVNTVQGSNSNYQPYAASGSAANGMLSNALGLNGASGNATATSAFQAAPGYQYTVDQATQAAQRAAAASGMNASGNTLTAVSQLGANLANQGYQQYLTNLQAQGSQGLTADAGISNNNQAAAGYQTTGATQGANLVQQTGTSLGSLDAMLGNQQGAVQSNLGTGIGALQSGLGNSLVANNNNATTNLDALGTADAKAQDTATNNNNGIFSNFIKNTASGVAGFL